MATNLDDINEASWIFLFSGEGSVITSRMIPKQWKIALFNFPMQAIGFMILINVFI